MSTTKTKARESIVVLKEMFLLSSFSKIPDQSIRYFVEAASLKVVLLSLSPRNSRGTLKRSKSYYCKLQPNNA